MARRVPYGSLENKNLLEKGQLTCTICKSVFPLSNFYKDKYALCGYKGTCKSCAMEQMRKTREGWKSKHVSKLVLVKKELFCHGCKENLPTGSFSRDACNHRGFAYRCKTCTKKRPSSQPEYLSWQQRKKLYGVTKEKYYEMLAKQNGVCAICKRIPKRFVIDHCHKTGKVRELLCDGCNHGLGSFSDNITLCRDAALYLEKHNGKT